MNYATEYTDKVLSGEIVACKKIKQAARRYRRDLKASKRKRIHGRITLMRTLPTKPLSLSN